MGGPPRCTSVIPTFAREAGGRDTGDAEGELRGSVGQGPDEHPVGGRAEVGLAPPGPQHQAGDLRVPGRAVRTSSSPSRAGPRPRSERLPLAVPKSPANHAVADRRRWRSRPHPTEEAGRRTPARWQWPATLCASRTLWSSAVQIPAIRSAASSAARSGPRSSVSRFGTASARRFVSVRTILRRACEQPHTGRRPRPQRGGRAASRRGSRAGPGPGRLWRRRRPSRARQLHRRRPAHGVVHREDQPPAVDPRCGSEAAPNVGPTESPCDPATAPATTAGSAPPTEALSTSLGPPGTRRPGTGTPRQGRAEEGCPPGAVCPGRPRSEAPCGVELATVVRTIASRSSYSPCTTSSGRRSLHTYEALVWPGRSHTRESPTSVARVACSQYSGTSAVLTNSPPVHAGSTATRATVAITEARRRGCAAVATARAESRATPTTSAAPALFVVRSSPRAATCSRAAFHAAPTAVGRPTGGSPP